METYIDEWGDHCEYLYCPECDGKIRPKAEPGTVEYDKVGVCPRGHGLWRIYDGTWRWTDTSELIEEALEWRTRCPTLSGSVPGSVEALLRDLLHALAAWHYTPYREPEGTGTS